MNLALWFATNGHGERLSDSYCGAITLLAFVEPMCSAMRGVVLCVGSCRSRLTATPFVGRRLNTFSVQRCSGTRTITALRRSGVAGASIVESTQDSLLGAKNAQASEASTRRKDLRQSLVLGRPIVEPFQTSQLSSQRWRT